MFLASCSPPRTHIHRGFEAGEAGGKTQEQGKVRVEEEAAAARAPGPKQMAVREAVCSLSAEVLSGH